ncbi:MAG: hypothetical protein ACOYJB_03715 [Christensenellaceae bacterium]|jgi:hypothetical protein
MECKKEQNKLSCACTSGCEKSGTCCECVRNHRSKGQFPACFFSKEAEAKYDRSFEALVADRRG